MPQPNDLSRSLFALDQNSTIIAVVEMSQSSWLVDRTRKTPDTADRGSRFRSPSESHADSVSGQLISMSLASFHLLTSGLDNHPWARSILPVADWGAPVPPQTSSKIRPEMMKSCRKTAYRF